MEIQIIILAVVVAFLTLVILGALREIMLLRASAPQLGNPTSQPAEPSFLGNRIPEPLESALASLEASELCTPLLVAFVSAGCEPCETLIRNSRRMAGGSSGLSSDRLVFIVVARSQAEAMALVKGVPFPVIVDGDGKIGQASEIRATPTLFLVSTEDYHLIDYTLSGDIEWMTTHLNHQLASITS